MKSNKGKFTSPELRLRGSLVRSGVGGFRLHWRDIPGKPDISFPDAKLAIFVNGCFWHRCPHCRPKLPKTNVEYWRDKFVANKKRDKSKIVMLKRMGWNSVVLWECEIKNDLEACMNKVVLAMT